MCCGLEVETGKPRTGVIGMGIDPTITQLTSNYTNVAVRSGIGRQSTGNTNWELYLNRYNYDMLINTAKWVSSLDM